MALENPDSLTWQPLKKEVARDGKNKASKDKLETCMKVFEWLTVEKMDVRIIPSTITHTRHT